VGREQIQQVPPKCCCLFANIDEVTSQENVCDLSMLVVGTVVSLEEDQIQTLLKQDKKADILRGVN
jgi:hypothetical protein